MKHSILFICMGNICRSPTAEGVFRHLVRNRGVEHLFHIDSAGTHSYHVGDPPDRRAIEAAARRGIDLSSLCARQVEDADFECFDWLLVMDEDNYERLVRRCAQEKREKIRLFLEYAPDTGRRTVPDPYYGGTNAFEEVLDLIEQASEGLLEALLGDAPSNRQTGVRPQGATE